MCEGHAHLPADDVELPEGASHRLVPLELAHGLAVEGNVFGDVVDGNRFGALEGDFDTLRFVVDAHGLVGVEGFGMATHEEVGSVREGARQVSDRDDQMSIALGEGWPGTQPRWIEGVAPRRRESQHSPMARTVCLSPGVQEPPAGARPALFRAPSCGGEGRFYVAGAAALLAGCSCVLSGGRASSHLVPSPPAEGKQGGWPPLNAEISACKKKMDYS